jgi:hypothetical protein
MRGGRAKVRGASRNAHIAFVPVGALVCTHIPFLDPPASVDDMTSSYGEYLLKRTTEPAKLSMAAELRTVENALNTDTGIADPEAAVRGLRDVRHATEASWVEEYVNLYIRPSMKQVQAILCRSREDVDAWLVDDATPLDERTVVAAFSHAYEVVRDTKTWAQRYKKWWTMSWNAAWKRSGLQPRNFAWAKMG